MARFADLRASQPKEIKDLYPTERNTAISLIANAQSTFKHETNFDPIEKEYDRIRFQNVIAELFEKHMRLIVEPVTWTYEVNDIEGDDTLFCVPRVVIAGRMDALDEVDHDRMQYEVRAGEADGREGVTDPNDPEAKLKDPKSKNIY